MSIFLPIEYSVWSMEKIYSDYQKKKKTTNLDMGRQINFKDKSFQWASKVLPS